ncbi:hypothetical protein C0X58_03330 [Salmonella enterica]|uniref:Uncharacterized protein n=1 Tax=Salmonella enterica subsp. arizonae TaxID=59203 RepID=A0A379S510_SALER|nr:hypothetical protein [Salmonella enterica]SUG15180.1 Uncharacterised protein [Salmonella enterica subsp. arizonae]ECF7339393.1 hypothetical protein [Salmonella enterica]ECG3547977.1 hypothetical protein [Salmonella enterica]EDO3522705.1 hypothetical protein [Salmonella enterica]
MAIFMEVRCEGCGDIEGCFSSQNAGSMTSARESVKGVSMALKFLKNDSLKAGWVLHKGELYCPVCAKAKAWDAAGIGVKQQEDRVDSDQPGMVVAVHIDAGDFVKVKGQVFEVEETDFDDHDVTLWFVGGNALKCAAGCPVEVVSAPVAAGIKVKGGVIWLL